MSLRITGLVLEATRHDGADYAYSRLTILTGTDTERVKVDDAVWRDRPLPERGEEVDLIVRAVPWIKDGAQRPSLSVQAIRPYGEQAAIPSAVTDAFNVTPLSAVGS